MKALRFLLNVATGVYIIIGLPAIALALLLVVRGETMSGRIFGVAAIVFFPVPVLLWFATFLKRRRSLLLTTICLLASAMLLFAACYYMTPDGRAQTGASADSIFKGEISYKKASIANLVPEIDQLKLGTYVFPRIDPYIDAARAVRIRRLFLNIYRDMQQSDEFSRLGSVMNYVYRDIFLGSRPTGHFYQYIPKLDGNNGKLPVILFLHGSLGNFKGYLWMWKKFADEHGFAIVAPSFGLGNWYLDGGVEAIEKARQYCFSHPRMDSKRIYLAGLSNGGTGVTRAAAANGGAYAGFIFISPVIEDDIILMEQFLNVCKSRRVLVLHGEEDERIPAKYVKQSVTILKKQGVNVESRFYPEEDHFLLFSKADQIRGDIAAWLLKISPDASRAE